MSIPTGEEKSIPFHPETLTVPVHSVELPQTNAPSVTESQTPRATLQDLAGRKNTVNKLINKIKGL